MTNNTPIYWEANGLSLHTEAWSVRTFGGRRYTGRSRRGSDVQVPFRRGRLRGRKVVDSQVLSLSMWMVPLNQDGTRDESMSLEQKMHANWQTLLGAIDVDTQFPLVKRWWEGGSVKGATAMAEFADGMEPSTEGGYRQTFNVDFLLSDPYFYSAVAAQAVGSITVQGQVPTDHVVLSLTGGTNQRVTFPDGNWVQYNGSPEATPVVINLLTGMATRSGLYVNGLIQRSTNFAEWPTLKPGSNDLTLTGGGEATVAYDAAYR